MRPHGKYARVNDHNPENFAQCDRCGFWRSGSDLIWQIDWAGTRLYNKRILVCSDRCFDTPQEQLRSLVLPPDPLPVLNAREPNFAYEEQTVLIAQFGGTDSLASPNAQPPWAAGPQLMLCDQSGEIPLVLQYLTSS